MREQTRLVFWLLAAMCTVRFTLALFGYAAPEALMASLGTSAEANPQMPYMVRVWAVRDVVLAVLVVLSQRSALMPLLVACVVIDTTDVITAILSGAQGLFDVQHTIGLMGTAIAALVPELLALWFIRRNPQSAAAKTFGGQYSIQLSYGRIDKSLQLWAPKDVVNPVPSEGSTLSS